MKRTLHPSEADWQRTICEALTLYGWHWNHVRRSVARRGTDGKPDQWMTTTSAKGWPDLMALRDSWLLVIEVKGEKTPFGREQIDWLRRFSQLPSSRVWVLRPHDPWEGICFWLQYPDKAPARYGW